MCSSLLIPTEGPFNWITGKTISVLILPPRILAMPIKYVLLICLPALIRTGGILMTAGPSNMQAWLPVDIRLPSRLRLITGNGDPLIPYLPSSSVHPTGRHGGSRLYYLWRLLGLFFFFLKKRIIFLVIK